MLSSNTALGGSCSVSDIMGQKFKFEKNSDDLYKQLERKESDLVLDGELGSALLDKNADISKQREANVVEYSQKLEVTQIWRQLKLLFFYSRLLSKKISNAEAARFAGGASF
jgi:hypothetical protein